MVTKENATSFLTSKKQSQNMYALEQPGQIKDNYEVLLEQIYIERSVSWIEKIFLYHYMYNISI